MRFLYVHANLGRKESHLRRGSGHMGLKIPLNGLRIVVVHVRAGPALPDSEGRWVHAGTRYLWDADAERTAGIRLTSWNNGFIGGAKELCNFSTCQHAFMHNWAPS